MNRVKTVILLSALTAILILLGDLIGGMNGVSFALLLAALMNFTAWWFSDKIILSIYRAREISEEESPELHRILGELSSNAGIPKPKLYLVPMEHPNAFATGRSPNKSAVAVTRGLLNLLDREEIKGVLAHEMAHILNRDTLVSAVAATIAGAIMWIANWLRYLAIFASFGGRNNSDRDNNPLFLLLLAIIAPVAAMIIQFAISRSREFLADSTGAELAHSPFGLARALKKIAYYSTLRPVQVNPATTHLFIVNPLSGKSILNLFSTHPPVEERIRRLVGANYAELL